MIVVNRNALQACLLGFMLSMTSKTVDAELFCCCGDTVTHPGITGNTAGGEDTEQSCLDAVDDLNGLGSLSLYCKYDLAYNTDSVQTKRWFVASSNCYDDTAFLSANIPRLITFGSADKAFLCERTDSVLQPYECAQNIKWIHAVLDTADQNDQNTSTTAPSRLPTHAPTHEPTHVDHTTVGPTSRPTTPPTTPPNIPPRALASNSFSAVSTKSTTTASSSLPSDSTSVPTSQPILMLTTLVKTSDTTLLPTAADTNSNVNTNTNANVITTTTASISSPFAPHSVSGSSGSALPRAVVYGLVIGAAVVIVVITISVALLVARNSRRGARAKMSGTQMCETKEYAHTEYTTSTHIPKIKQLSPPLTSTTINEDYTDNGYQPPFSALSQPSYDTTKIYSQGVDDSGIYSDILLADDDVDNDDANTYEPVDHDGDLHGVRRDQLYSYENTQAEPIDVVDTPQYTNSESLTAAPGTSGYKSARKAPPPTLNTGYANARAVERADVGGYVNTNTRDCDTTTNNGVNKHNVDTDCYDVPVAVGAVAIVNGYVNVNNGGNGTTTTPEPPLVVDDSEYSDPTALIPSPAYKQVKRTAKTTLNPQSTVATDTDYDGDGDDRNVVINPVFSTNYYETLDYAPDSDSTYHTNTTTPPPTTTTPTTITPTPTTTTPTTPSTMYNTLRPPSYADVDSITPHSHNNDDGGDVLYGNATIEMGLYSDAHDETVNNNDNEYDNNNDDDDNDNEYDDDNNNNDDEYDNNDDDDDGNEYDNNNNNDNGKDNINDNDNESESEQYEVIQHRIDATTPML